MVNIYNKILLRHYKEWYNAICSNMDGPTNCNAKWNKLDKDKYHISLTCGIQKKGTNEIIYKT